MVIALLPPVSIGQFVQVSVSIVTYAFSSVTQLKRALANWGGLVKTQG